MCQVSSTNKKIITVFIGSLANKLCIFLTFLSMVAVAEPNRPAIDKNLNHKTSKKAKRYGDSFFSSTIENKPRTEKELNLILSGLNSLLPVEKSPLKKNEMLISKSITLLSLGKHYYLNEKLPNAKQKKENYLKLAMKAANEASNNQQSNYSLKAKAFHIYGMASLYFENELKAVDYFEQSIKTDPKSSLTPRLSVFIGEYYFDHEKYEIALPYYSQYFNRLNKEEMSLALYKSAWCYFNLKQFENAEKAFIKIAGKSWAGDFGKDAIRDLAQVVTSYKKESEIIEFGVNFFSTNQPEVLIEFYTNCYMIMLRQSGNLELISLYNEIQRLEKRPEKKVTLAIRKLSVHQKGYASLQVFKDINEIDSIMTSLSIKPELEVFKYFATDLEIELQRSISSYVDTISKKIKTPENIAEIELANKLQRLLWYHVAWFPNSPKISQTYMLALDNCLYLKDSECSLKISKLILRQANLKSVWPRARVEIVLALEHLAAKDPKYQPEFEKELKNYADTQTNEKEWLPFTKKLTSMYIAGKKFAEVEPYLIQILNKENNSENLYRKIFCQYNLKKNIEVIKHLKQIPTNGQYQKEIQFLIRESSLNLAKEFNDKNDFNNYEKYLFQYLSLQPEPEKADLVMADYLQKLVVKQDFIKVINYYSKLTTNKKFEGVLSKPFEQLLINLFSMNRFQESYELLSKGSSFGQYRNFDYYWVRTIVGLNGTLSLKEFKILSTSQPEFRLSILSHAAVAQPTLAINYFKSFPPVNENEKKVWLISIQMNSGERQVELNNYEQKHLNSVVSSEIKPPNILKSEKMSKQIEFPQPQWSQTRLAKITPDAMDRIKAVRSQIVRDIKGQPAFVQKRVLLNGINNEKKMAWFFDESPVPKDLSKEESKDYKTQMESFAVEYYQQIGEYEKMLAAILSKEVEQASTVLPIPKNIDLWIRNKTPSLMLADSEYKKGNSLRALFILEAQKEIGKIHADEFYRWRDYIILSEFPNSFAAEYLQEELLTYKQAVVMNEWGKVVGYTISDRSTASEERKH